MNRHSNLARGLNPEVGRRKALLTLAKMVLLLLGGVVSASAQATTATATAVIGPTAPYYTDDVTGTVTVTGTGGTTPTGSVTGSTDGGALQSVALANGIARLELKFFAPGAHSFVYSYGGDGNYAASASQTLNFRVADRSFALTGSEYQYFATSISNGTTFTAALDSKNNIYLPSPAGNILSKLDPQGNVTTVPTTGLSRPNGIVIDKSDNIYLADSGNARVVEISAGGTQTVVPITGLIDPLSMAFDAAEQNLYITDQGNGGIIVYNIAAHTQTVISTNMLLSGVAVDASGDVYYSAATSAFSGDGKVYRRDPSGNTITIFTGLSGPEGLLFDQRGDLYIESGQGLFVLDTQSHLSQLTYLTSLSRPVQGYLLPGNIAMDRRGNIYRPSANSSFNPGKSVDAGPAPYDPNYDYGFYVYYQVAYQQTLIAVAAVSGSPVATLGNYVPTPGNSPASVPFIYFDELFSLIPYAGPWSSNITVTSSDGKQANTIVYGTGLADAFAAAPGTITPQSLTVSGIGGTVADPTGDIYVSDPASNQVVKLPPGSTTTTVVPFTGLNKPTQLALDGEGSVYVLDSGSARILKVDAAGNQSVAFSLSAQTALTSLTAFTMDGATNLYLAGNAAAGQSAIYYLDTLGNQLLVAGGLTAPTALAVDFNGYVFSADTGGILTRFGPAGDATQIATGLSQPASISIDASDTVYVAGAASSGVTIVSPDGTETAYPVDALPADDLTNASVVAVIPDGSGSLAVGDSSGKQVFRIVRGNNPLGAAGASVNDDFGDVAIGSSRTIGGFVSNVGNVATPAFGVTSAQPDFSWATDPQECVNHDDGSGGNPPLAPGASCGAKVTFAPTYIGTQTDGLNIFVPNTFDILLGINATGNAVAATGAPALAISPTTATFPSTAQGASSVGQVFAITNSGTASATISSLSIGGADADSFTQTNNCGATLAVNTVCAATVVFTPTTAGGTFNGTLSVTSNDPKSPAVATFTGSSPAAAAPAATLTPASLGFGSVTVGTKTASQTLTLSSTGNAPLIISSIALTGANAASFAETTTCGSTLGAGATCTIAVTFDPAAAGSLSAAVKAQFGGGVATLASTLSGTGTAATAPAAVLTPTSLSFTGVAAGTTSAAQILTLSNPGTATLNITSVAVAGANSSDFAATSNCGSSVAAAGSCTISVTFTPASAGATESATIAVQDNAAGSPQSAALSGTSPAAPPPQSADFTIAAQTTSQTVSHNQPAQYTILLGPAQADEPFDAAITLSATGLPSGATASFSPATVTPNAAQVSTVMTVTVGSMASQTSRPPGFPRLPSTITLAAMTFLFSIRRLRKARGAFLGTLMMIALAAGFASMTGCSDTRTGFATPISTSTITVTGTSGTLQHATTVTLTVQ